MLSIMSPHESVRVHTGPVLVSIEDIIVCLKIIFVNSRYPRALEKRSLLTEGKVDSTKTNK